jgi:hypothetical protein
LQEYTIDQMRVMLHDVSDIVSSEPDRFGERTEEYSYESMHKCSFAHAMGMPSYLLDMFHRQSLQQRLW